MLEKRYQLHHFYPVHTIQKKMIVIKRLKKDTEAICNKENARLIERLLLKMFLQIKPKRCKEHENMSTSP